jgi:hypothetical protein
VNEPGDEDREGMAGSMRWRFHKDYVTWICFLTRDSCPGLPWPKLPGLPMAGVR